jgi:hypothetical protein
MPQDLPVCHMGEIAEGIGNLQALREINQGKKFYDDEEEICLMTT